MPLTIHEAAVAIRQGQLTPVDLVEQCLERIDRFEAKIQAWVLIDRQGALTQARRAIDELKGGQDRGPLHGIPIGIKDLFDVFDWPTAAGSKLWARSIARRDATVVRKLRQAGAILLGKTVTTQYASFDPPPTRNPWNQARTPGGSSSGSAAAVACGMCLGALGSQTGGSITRPASYCGVAGCKPTYGRVSVAGVVPLAHSMDHPGPIGRCVTDLALMLQVMAGPDQEDPHASDWPVADYVAELHRPQPPRLGLVHGMFKDRAEPVMRQTMTEVCRRLSEEGAMIQDVALPASFREVIQRHRTVMAVEAAMFHEQRLREHPEDYLPRIRALLEEGLSCPATEYARTKLHQEQLRQEMNHSFAGVDVLLVPATPGPAPDASTTGDPVFNSPWSYTGLPVVSIPAGWTPEGLPLAIQLVGPPGQEGEVLAAAAWCEDRLAVEKREPQPG